MLMRTLLYITHYNNCWTLCFVLCTEMINFIHTDLRGCRLLVLTRRQQSAGLSKDKKPFQNERNPVFLFHQLHFRSCCAFFFLSFLLSASRLHAISLSTLHPEITACAGSLFGCQKQETAMPGFTGQTQPSDDAAVWVIAGLWPALTLRQSCFLPASQGHSFTHFQQTEWRDKNICLPKALYLNECTCELILWFESQWYIAMPVLLNADGLLNVSYFLRSVLTDHEAHLNNPSAGPILNKRTQGELCMPRFTGPWLFAESNTTSTELLQ